MGGSCLLSSSLLPMTTKQSDFIAHYLANGGNGTKAAIAAGYAVKSARITASTLLSMPTIRKAIDEHRKKIYEKVDVSLSRVVLEISKVAFFELGELLEVEKNGIRIKNLSELSADVRGAVSEITDTDTAFGTKRTVKLYSKLNALDMLMKHLGGYVTVQDIIDKMTPEQVEELSQKLLSKLKNEEAR